jgi:cytochrome c oxidase subunit 2
MKFLSVALTMTAVGHQWYWSYEFGDFHRATFDAYMVPDEDLYTW